MRKKLNQLIWFVDSEYEKVVSDDRYKREPVSVNFDAPLAVIQSNLYGRMSILKEVKELIKEILEKEDG